MKSDYLTKGEIVEVLTDESRLFGKYLGLIGDWLVIEMQECRVYIRSDLVSEIVPLNKGGLRA